MDLSLLQELETLRLQCQQLQYRNYQLASSVPVVQSSPLVHIQCPGNIPSLHPSFRVMFLAGPVDSENWQNVILKRLEGHSVLILNPRPLDDTLSQKKHDQHGWENIAFETANIAVFWFPWKHANSTSSLLQLGRCSAIKGTIFVGVHSSHKDRKSIISFVKDLLPQVKIVSSVDKLATQILYWIQNGVYMQSNSSSSSETGDWCVMREAHQACSA
jgi:hypothetical protein